LLLFAAVLALTSASLFAADPGRYRDWANSPQGYFLTAAEREAWGKVKSEGDAERFVAEFLAKRGPGFAAEVEAAAKEADAHLTAGRKPGSKTLRGRIVILLGPPAGFSVTQAKGASTSMNDYSSRARVGKPQTVIVGSSAAAAPITSELRKRYPADYTFTYAKEKLPGAPDQDRVIVVSVNPESGDDRILDARMAREVSALLEAAAVARAGGQHR
jgi:GWxTD domain-containing protein